MGQVSPVQPILPIQPAPLGDVQRLDIKVVVSRNAKGEVAVTFDGADRKEFQVFQHMCLLVFHLETEGDSCAPAVFATVPFQFKDESGQPVPAPESLRITRDRPTRCTVLAVNTAVVAEPYRFHVVFVYDQQVIGSPDPTIILEPPPCSGSNCPADDEGVARLPFFPKS